MEKPPPPGVSTLPLGSSGRSSSVGAQSKAAPAPRVVTQAPAKVMRSQPKPPMPKADPIDPSKGRQVSTAAPVGVAARGQDIVEIPMPRSKNSERTSATIRSVDGNTYRFRYLDAHGREFPWTKSLALMIALIEQAKGGDVLEVFRAFNLRFGDEDGKEYFPVPEAILLNLRSNPTQDSVFGGMGDVQETPSEEEEEEQVDMPSFFGGNG